MSFFWKTCITFFVAFGPLVVADLPDLMPEVASSTCDVREGVGTTDEYACADVQLLQTEAIVNFVEDLTDAPVAPSLVQRRADSQAQAKMAHMKAVDPPRAKRAETVATSPIQRVISSAAGAPISNTRKHAARTTILRAALPSSQLQAMARTTIHRVSSSVSFWNGALLLLAVMVLPFHIRDILLTIQDHWRESAEDIAEHQQFFSTEDLIEKNVFTPDVQNPDGHVKGLVGQIDEVLRMDINGESKEQMEHAKELKRDGKWDSTVDEKWSIDESLRFNDNYVLLTSAMWIIPKFIIFAIPLFLTAIPYFFIVKIYQCFMKAPTDVVRRNTFLFIFFMEILARILVFVPFAIGRVALWCDFFFYYLFSIFFLIVFKEDGWPGYCKSRAIIGPYESGPQTRLTDLMVCALGQVARNGVCECAKTYAGTYLLLPWLKYYVNANPFIYPLEERFVQQISTSMKDLGLAPATDAAREIISRSKQANDFVGLEHQWDFIPHYPYPPPGRRWANGIQHVGKFFELIVHTTHAHAEAMDSWEQFVLSNSVAVPVYRVMLWYNNPYHFFTGFVEASISTGQPSQPAKKYGGEHPMWLITSRSPLLAARDSRTGVGMIDAFFDYWLPDFVDGVRYLVTRDPQYVLDNHQEVISKDGISAPAEEKGGGAAVRAKLVKAKLLESGL